MSVLSRPAPSERRPLDTDDRCAPTVVRVGALALATAPLTMSVGAAFLFPTGVDFDAASQGGRVDQLLGDIVANSTSLTVTFVVWLLSMTVFAVAAWSLPRLPLPAAATHAAAGMMGLGTAVGAVAFVSYLTVVHAAAPTRATDVAVALTWLASNFDWVATILLIGIPPALLVLSDRSDLFPTWLRRSAILPLVASAATAVSLLSGTGLDTFGFVLVPIGVPFTTAVGITIWRRA